MAKIHFSAHKNNAPAHFSAPWRRKKIHGTDEQRRGPDMYIPFRGQILTFSLPREETSI